MQMYDATRSVERIESPHFFPPPLLVDNPYSFAVTSRQRRVFGETFQRGKVSGKGKKGDEEASMLRGIG